MPLKLMFITNDPQVALVAQKHGVDRVWVDLESLGKEERQRGLNSVKSKHTVEDVKKLSPLMTSSELMVRINPWNEGSKNEIDAVIDAGAQIVMLPMWKSAGEVKCFIDAVASRAKTVLLLETAEAERCLDEVLTIRGIDEIHIGLNDLHLSYRLTFMFELLADGTVEKICKKIAAAGIPYGFGGIARIGEGLLSAEKIVTEHYRLGSTRAILSRSFCNTDEIGNIAEIDRVFEENMKKLRDFERSLCDMTEDDFLKNTAEVRQGVAKIVDIIKEKRDECRKG